MKRENMSFEIGDYILDILTRDRYEVVDIIKSEAQDESFYTLKDHTDNTFTKEINEDEYREINEHIYNIDLNDWESRYNKYSEHRTYEQK